ncbi:MAG: zinc ABC transporter substrate-binding protein [Gammaproteobacteria bacterium]|nr:zinc ABC transporter substrate-binding protein [Gammaproteobacteria bacterium]
MKKIIALIFVLGAPAHAQALEIFACEPEWGSLVSEIAGELANVTTATTAFQDPHSLQARPSLIAAVRNADLLVCTGADLEVGWLPLLLRRSGNPDIQPGNSGYFLAADYVRRIEIPRLIDRAQGDVHPQGNPHIHLNPRNVSRVADALAERLAAIDPENSAVYLRRLDDFQARWDAANDAWAEKAELLDGLRLASHHRSFSYLADWLNLDIVAVLESKPGVPPSGAQLAALLEQLTPNPPAGVIRTPYENEKPSNWLSSRLDLPAIMLPFTVGATDDVVDLFTLYDETIDMLMEYAN